MTPEKAAYARQRFGEPDRTVASIARLLGVSRSTLYKVMPDLVPAQRGAAVADARLAQLPADTAGSV